MNEITFRGSQGSALEPVALPHKVTPLNSFPWLPLEVKEFKVVEQLKPEGIPLGKNYRLTSDAYNIILEQRFVGGDKAKVPGQERWQPIRYYSNIENALLGLIDLEISKTGLKSVAEVATKINELKGHIHATLANRDLYGTLHPSVEEKKGIPCGKQVGG